MAMDLDVVVALAVATKAVDLDVAAAVAALMIYLARNALDDGIFLYQTQCDLLFPCQTQHGVLSRLGVCWKNLFQTVWKVLRTFQIRCHH